MPGVFVCIGAGTNRQEMVWKVDNVQWPGVSLEIVGSKEDTLRERTELLFQGN